jgi:hypothetical protein
VAARIAHAVRPAAPGKASDAFRDPGPHDTPRRPAPPRVLPDQNPRRPDGVRWLTQPARSPPRRRTRPRSSGGSRTRSPRTPRPRPSRPHPTTTRPFQGSTSPLTERPPGRRHQRPTSPVAGSAVLRAPETSGGAARRRRLNARFAAESPARTGFLTSGALVAPQVQHVDAGELREGGKLFGGRRRLPGHGGDHGLGQESRSTRSGSGAVRRRRGLCEPRRETEEGCRGRGTDCAMRWSCCLPLFTRCCDSAEV